MGKRIKRTPRRRVTVRDFADLERENAELKRHNGELQSWNAALSDELKRKSDANEQLREANGSLAKERAGLRDDLVELDRQRAELQRAGDNRLAGLTARIESDERAYEALARRFNRLCAGAREAIDKVDAALERLND